MKKKSFASTGFALLLILTLALGRGGFKHLEELQSHHINNEG